ncbi:MAG: acyltransferase, partial [Clostridia bacterium]|nr:acyltransferase [Clostridia bacterium]
IIMGFHLWQQSWLQYVIPRDIFAFLGVRNFSLVWIPRTGYMLVDVLLLLSAFCLFLPYARQMTDPLSPAPDSPGLFYKKRLVRILPPYYLCILVYAIFLVRPADYPSLSHYLRDLFSHITFTHTMSAYTYFNTQYPTTLWTLCAEMQFYLIFPLLARLFRRFPLQTWICMNIAAQLFISFFAHTADGGADSFMINRLPAFLGVFANGMLAAYFCCFLRKDTAALPQKAVKRLATGISIFLFCALVCMLKDGLNRAGSIQRWQVDYRFCFSLFVCVLILALDHAHRPLQFVFSCKPVRFLAAISYNLYLWHAPVLLQLKALRIPWYPDAPEGASAWPQSASSESWHRAWQFRYVAVFWLVTLLLAALITYLFEEPLRKALMKLKIKRKA